jgi:hypothetical protein
MHDENIECDPLMGVTPAQARSWRWSAEAIPLCPDRNPFLNYSNDAILSYFRFLRLYPEAYGRLGRFVRTKLGIGQPCPVRYTFREAHIDVSDADQSLADFLLSLGFEPDHFQTLNPPEYTKCFTARFEIPSERVHRSRKIAHYISRSTMEAEERVQQAVGRFAYSEIEYYTHKNKRSFEFRPLTEEALRNFPFKANAFRAIGAFPKKLDIHVKIPTQAKGIAYQEAECPEMLKLRQLFLSAGFYEIRSLSGNAIYTAQMVDGKRAKAVFKLLCDWGLSYGGIISIELEVCTRFWRSEIDTAQGVFFAPVPKVVAISSM